MQLICPKCGSDNTYEDSSLWNCLECSHDWVPQKEDKQEEVAASQSDVVKDAFGNILSTGDAVIVIKYLKVKGSSSVVKGGTKVKSIRLVESTDGHNIACKIDGIGAMNLKSEFVKKA